MNMIEDNNEIASIPVPKIPENESEFYPLKTSEAIDNINSKINKISSDNKFKLLNQILYFLFILAFILIFFQFISLIAGDKTDISENDDKFTNLLNSNNSKQLNNNSSLLLDEEISNPEKKITVGFLYPSLSGNGIARFMQVTGDYLIKSGKYNVIFITKPKQKKELDYNSEVKRFYCHDNLTLIKDTCKNEKIDFLIMNNFFSANYINQIKSIGTKTIGIYHGVFMSSMFNNHTKLYNSWKNLDLYDAFIHISADDYYFFTNFKFTRNIFIPNMYTFDPDEAPQSDLKSHQIMMLGRLIDKKKGLIYAIKAMSLVVKEVPDAKLNLVSSDSIGKKYGDIINNLGLNKNIIVTPFTTDIQKHFLESSVFLFPSLTEAFPMALNEAKAYGLPCVGFNVDYSIPFKKGIIKVNMFDYQALANEIIKLLKDYDYRIKMGKESKLSLNMFNNVKTTEMWGMLFNSLLKGEKEFQKYRRAVMKKFYNMTLAKSHLEQQFEYVKEYNKFFSCYTLDDFTSLSKINKIQLCSNVK